MVVCFTLLHASVGDTRLYSRGVYTYIVNTSLKQTTKIFTYPQRVKKLVILFISIKIYVARGIYKGHSVFLSFAL